MLQRNRFDNALFIGAGGCNGRAISRALVEAYAEAAAEKHDTTATNRDPAVQIILHQLCHLARIGTDDYAGPGGFNYHLAWQACIDRCQSYKTLVTVGEANRACLFVCDYHIMV